MNIVDLIVIGAVILSAWLGWRIGFIAGLMSLVGFVGAGLVGVFVTPRALDATRAQGIGGLLLTAAIVLGLALVGQMIASMIGRKLRSKITWRPAQVVDNIGGSALRIMALAVVAWFLVSTASALPISSVSASVQSSTLLSSLESVVPNPARDLFGNLRTMIDNSVLPDVLDTFGVGTAPVDPPSPAVVSDPDVQQALDSVVKVQGAAPSCSTGFTGSGFVVANGLVLTNAHVVAGVERPTIHVPHIGMLKAQVVYFDPRVDVAILRANGLTAKPLRMSGPVQRGTDAVIAGYPGGGSMTATAARVRGTINGSIDSAVDIYGKIGIPRQIYGLRGTARPGNSGGPLILSDGTVAGVVFAQAETDPQMAYALTAKQVAPAIAAAQKLTTPVSTEGCAKER